MNGEIKPNNKRKLNRNTNIMKNRKQQITDAMQPVKIKKGFGYFLKLSGNPKMKDVAGELTEAWKNFLIKNNRDEK